MREESLLKNHKMMKNTAEYGRGPPAVAGVGKRRPENATRAWMR
jgi:hypothetical protein